jgi:hypothetical protein
VLVWFEKDRVVRVAARHRGIFGQPALAGKALAEAWGRDTMALGWPRRQDMAAGSVIQAWSNHDDVTQVRVFWQEEPGSGPRLYTEWQVNKD